MEYKTKNLKQTAAVFFGVFTWIGLAVAVLRIWMLSFRFDPTTGFYSQTGFLLTAFYGVCYGAVVLALLSAVVLRKKIRISQFTPSASSVFSGTFCGFLLLASAALLLTDLNGLAAQSGFAYAVLVLSVPAALYFILEMVMRNLKMTPHVLLCFTVIFWAAASLMNLYFEKTLVINNPAKVAEQLALISVMAYFLFECRFIVEKPCPALYLGVSSAAMILLSASVLPNLIAAFFFGMTMTTGLGSQIAELGLLVYIFFRTTANIGRICGKLPDSPPESRKNGTTQQ